MKEALGFLMTREIAHQQSFEKALYAIEPNFPPGKQPGDPRFTSVYVNMSQGPGDEDGPWNQGGDWEYTSDRDEQAAVGGGDGAAAVRLPDADVELLRQLAARTASDPDTQPVTAAELGMVAKPGANGTAPRSH